MPGIEQVLLGRAADWSADEYERRLYLARKSAEKQAVEQGIAEFYMPSFSSRTIVYKGLFNAPQLDKFYTDLQSPLFETALAIFHQRYSTNTFPNWQLAQPFRMVAHNGEINTLIGNKNWTRARELELRSEVWGDNVEHLMPILQPEVSDSACIDNALETLELSGRDNIHAAMMLAPEIATCFGRKASFAMESLSKTLESSNGMLSQRVGLEPVATSTCWHLRVSSVVPSDSVAVTPLPSACTTARARR